MEYPEVAGYAEDPNMMGTLLEVGGGGVQQQQQQQQQDEGDGDPAILFAPAQW